MSKRIAARNTEPEVEHFAKLAFDDMTVLIARYESNVRSSLQVLQTMLHISLCIEDYCSTPSKLVNIWTAQDLCRTLRKVSPSDLTFDLVRKQVEAEIFRPMHTIIPLGFVYTVGHTINNDGIMKLTNIIRPPYDGMPIHGHFIRIQVEYLPTGFRARVDETAYL
jgi:hypothetical protein